MRKERILNDVQVGGMGAFLAAAAYTVYESHTGGDVDTVMFNNAVTIVLGLSEITLLSIRHGIESGKSPFGRE